ncbi:UDP-glucose flavonoid 3-O-glucosyltransferase 7 [Cajanus cajan]|uniref:Glycosyltransferase n=1 Tax=Cajanus cajan TaxID=3821 RepID=A0A151STP6_CAJCA|nr:UDP-glucose flavonoid 3-O-glucosyltransferase 7 [Cajanus cajan]KYP58165.1 Cytokinin-O-glucosyltransferase 3 [Cajanus cajan]
MEAEAERPLKLYFIPYLAAGHMIPLCDIAQFFASRGQHVTIITTPFNAQTLHQSKNFHVQTFQFPSQEVGLPEGVENLSTATDLQTSNRIYMATTLLRQPMESFVEQHPPDCIVADFLYPWVHDLALKLRIPRLVFNGFSLFTICAMEAVKTHGIGASLPFLIPDFPHHVTMNAAPPEDVRRFIESLLTVALKSDGFIINNFAELDGEEYLRHYERTTGHKAWHLGPASLVRSTCLEKAERGLKSVVSVEECVSWLDSKRVNSVVYICFGSICYFPDKQLYEIASAIEASGHEFIWVVPEKKGKENESEEEKENWLPKGFEERGMIIKGWAPQVVILGHPSVGAFLTHCGWNSTVEAVTAGVPMITWPVHSDQFYNEKLITRVRGIGVEVGAEEWTFCGFYECGKVVGRDRIEEAVRRVMDGGDEAQQIRRRAKEFAETARQAVGEGGSSYNNLTALIHHLKTLTL